MKYIFMLVLLLNACHPPVRRLDQSSHLYHQGKSLGKIDKRLKEASGLVRSVNNPGMLWAINDSGNKNEVFLLNSEAEVVKSFHPPIQNSDWEELVIYTDSSTEKTTLIIGDIGDNNGHKKTKTIYWMEEPHYDQQKDGVLSVDSLRIQLLDGPRDMEAMFVDPISRNLYLFSKREDSIGLYLLHEPFNKKEASLEKIASLPFTSIVAADISSCGKEIIIRDYNNIYYWTRMLQQPIEQVLLSSPVILPCENEMQGESVCFDANTNGYFTLSESIFFKRAELFYYKRK